MSTLSTGPAATRRRLTLLFLFCLATLATFASVASAANRQVSFTNDQTSVARSVVTYSERTSTGANGGTLEVLRNGVVIASDSEGRTLQAKVSGPLLAGDVARFTRAGSSFDFTYSGKPTVGPEACNGRTTFTGESNSNNVINLQVTAAGTGRDSRATYLRTDTTPSQDGKTYFTKVETRPLAEGDTVIVPDRVTTADSDLVSYTTYASVTACGAGVGVTPAPSGTTNTTTNNTTTNNTTTSPGTTTTNTTTTPGTTIPGARTTVPVAAPLTRTQLFAALQASLGQAGVQLNQVDLAVFLRKSRVAIPFAFLTPGKVTYRLTFASRGGTTTVATGTKTRTQPGTAKVSLKLGKKGKSLLASSKKRIRLTLSGSFQPTSGGKALTTKTKVTLKRKGS